MARHEHAGRLEPVRLGLRYSGEVPPQRSEHGALGPLPLPLAEGPLAAGRQRFGPFELASALDIDGDEASLDVVVRNRSEAPLYVASLVVGFRWREARGDTRFLRHGWQSWSLTEGAAVLPGGDAPFDGGPWLRGLHHALGASPEDRGEWHESSMISVAEDGEGRACLAGVIERGVGTSLVYWRREEEGVRVEVEIRLDVPLAAGEQLDFERIRVALGTSPNAMLERYAEELGRANGARTGGQFQVGWCSWYQYFHAVTEDDLLRNLEALSARRAEIPVDVVQLDDGYQRAIGDWLETNEKFPRGLPPLAQEIRAAGFRPGIWTAPFCVVRESRLFDTRPEWLLRQGDALHRGLLHRDWAADGNVYVLDTSREDVQRHLMRTAAALAGMGFQYQKHDFLYTAAMQADAHDPSVTRAARLRKGLAAIRDGAGDDAFLLGCGCPMGPAVGLVDGMRIGADTAPYWSVRGAVAGIEATQPSVDNALQGVFGRAWMHRRLWLNDPDCLLLRHRDTELSPDEVRTLAAGVAASGGMILVSDDVSALGAEETALFREVEHIARDVDAAAAVGTARAVGLLDEAGPRGLIARTPSAHAALLANRRDEAAVLEMSLLDALGSPGPLPPEPLLGTQDPEPRNDGTLRAKLPAHTSTLVRATAPVRLAVMCDYDGTFAVQDVGSTLAMSHAAERRKELWPRLEAGEFTPWSYNMELLDGMPLAEQVVDAFLKTVEPMPGAAELVGWCAAHRVPFRVLSDGFGRNLNRLQELHGIRFAYEANHLWYEDDHWRLAPGSPDPTCGCGTGVCKAARIRDLRAIHPEATVVHIGNGRVSDLCGARAADVVFAKDSLAEELAQQGVPFAAFDNLHDVLRELEILRQRLEETPTARG